MWRFLWGFFKQQKLHTNALIYCYRTILVSLRQLSFLKLHTGITKSQMFVYFKSQWLILEYVYLCVQNSHMSTSVFFHECVCMCTILSLFFFPLEDVWMDLSCPRQPLVKKPGRVSPSSLGVFLPLICPRVYWKGWHELSLCSPSLHTHLKKSSHTPQGPWVTQRDIQTIQGCTFVCTAVAFAREKTHGQGYVLRCVQKQTHAHTNQWGHGCLHANVEQCGRYRVRLLTDSVPCWHLASFTTFLGVTL